MAMPCLKHGIVAGIVKPAAKLPAIQCAQAMIEDAPVPTRCTAAGGGFSV
jgi:hypothetical protein